MKVDKDKCINCGACSSVCPPKSIEVLDRRIRVLEGCMNCGICRGACPVGAVEVD